MAALSEGQSKNQADKTANATALEILNKSTKLEKEKNNLLKGISRNMTATMLKLKIMENIAEQIGMTKKNENYVFQNKIMDQTQMIKFMLQFYKEQIQQAIQLSKTLFEFNINIDKKNIEINRNKQQKIILKQKKNNIKNNWKILSKELSKNNRKLIDGL